MNEEMEKYHITLYKTGADAYRNILLDEDTNSVLAFCIDGEKDIKGFTGHNASLPELLILYASIFKSFQDTLARIPEDNPGKKLANDILKSVMENFVENGEKNDAE